VIDSEILAVEAAAARLETSRTSEENAANLQSAVAAAVTHGKSIRDVAAAAHLTALEVLDAADAVTYPGPALQAPKMAQ
jgi:transcription initiation factor TFIIIB Brf1 subunit/transcription initiation factor TFIIB